MYIYIYIDIHSIYIYIYPRYIPQLYPARNSQAYAKGEFDFDMPEENLVRVPGGPWVCLAGEVLKRWFNQQKWWFNVVYIYK